MRRRSFLATVLGAFGVKAENHPEPYAIGEIQNIEGHIGLVHYWDFREPTGNRYETVGGSHLSPIGDDLFHQASSREEGIPWVIHGEEPNR